MDYDMKELTEIAEARGRRIEELEAENARLRGYALDPVNLRKCKFCQRETRATQISCTWCGVWDEPAARAAREEKNDD